MDVDRSNNNTLRMQRRERAGAMVFTRRPRAIHSHGLVVRVYETELWDVLWLLVFGEGAIALLVG